MVSVICVCDRLDPLSPRIHLRPTRHLDVASHHEARECFCKILISAHALYVGEQRRDRNTFREGIEWTVDAPLRENTAFNDFAVDAPRTGNYAIRPAVFRYAAVACTVHRRVGLDGADRSTAPTTLESQDDVRGSQRVSAVEREGASEVGSLEPSPPDRLSEQYHSARVAPFYTGLLTLSGLVHNL
jgi:hypothetical protein